MAPKGSPRMLLAASLLASNDKNIPVKVALSRAGFTAEEIAKEKKQRQARRRRDFLLKKKATTKIKGRRSMTTLPRSLPRNHSTQGSRRELQSVMNSSPTIKSCNTNNLEQSSQDTSRMDALVFACSIEKSISESKTPVRPSSRSA